MNGGAEDNTGRGGDDLLAAEYVLGVLPLAERQAAAARIGSEPDLAALVAGWEAHLAPLDAGYGEVVPPASVKAALDRRLFASTANATAKNKMGFWSSLNFWRGLSAAAIASLLLGAAQPLLSPGAGVPSRDLMVAALDAQPSSDVRYLALYDAATREVALSHVSGAHGENRDFELWMIEGGNAPASVGVIPAGSTIRIELSPELQEKLAQGAVLAISLEPEGGSPTGQPTGPVVAAGDLRDI